MNPILDPYYERLNSDNSQNVFMILLSILIIIDRTLQRHRLVMETRGNSRLTQILLVAPAAAWALDALLELAEPKLHQLLPVNTMHHRLFIKRVTD